MPDAKHPSPNNEAVTPNNSAPRLLTKDFAFIAIINLALFFSFQMTVIGMPVYVSQLGGTPIDIGLTTVLITATALLVRPFAGMILDRFGRKTILIISTVLTLATVVAYIFLNDIISILIIRLIQGIGWGLSSTATSTIAADIIPKARFAEGMGWYTAASAVSSAIAPATSVFLVQEIGAFAMFATAAAVLALGFLLGIALKDPIRQLLNNSSAAHSNINLEALFDKNAAKPSAMIFLLNMGFATVTSFIVVYATSKSVTDISLYFVVYAIVTIASRPIMGRIVDARGFMVPGLIAAACVAATLLIISAANSLWMFCLAGIFAGFGIGLGMSVFQTMAVASVPPSRKGVATSTYLIGLDGGVTAGSFVAGFAVTALGYEGMYAAMAVFPAIAFISFFIWQMKTKEQ